MTISRICCNGGYNVFVTCQATNVLALLAVQNYDLTSCKKHQTLLSGSSMIFRKPPE
jgi:hypothetical protein